MKTLITKFNTEVTVTDLAVSLEIAGKAVSFNLDSPYASELFIGRLLNRSRSEETELTLLANILASNLTAVAIADSSDFEFPASIVEFAKKYKLGYDRAAGKVTPNSVRLVMGAKTSKADRDNVQALLKDTSTCPEGYQLVTVGKPTAIQDKDGEFVGYGLIISPLVK